MVELAYKQASKRRKKVTKLTGPRLERAMFRQAKRVPNDKGSSLSTVGELNPLSEARERRGGNSSRSIPCRGNKALINIHRYLQINEYNFGFKLDLQPHCDITS